MITGVVYERDAEAVREENWRKGISWIRGQGFRDWALEEDEEDEEEEDEVAEEGEDKEEVEEGEFVDSVEQMAC